MPAYIPGTATAADVAQGKTFSAGTLYNAVGTYTVPVTSGTSLITQTPLTNQARFLMNVPPETYADGTTLLSATDANFSAANIRSDKSIFGLQGSLPVITSGNDPAQGAGQWPDGSLAVYPSEGYRKGGAGAGEIKVSPAQLQAADGNFVPSNIRNGVKIFGVTGNLLPAQAETGTSWTGPSVAPSFVSGTFIEWNLSTTVAKGKTLASLTVSTTNNFTSYVEWSHFPGARLHQNATWSFGTTLSNSLVGSLSGIMTCTLANVSYIASTGALSCVYRYTCSQGTLSYVGSGNNIAMVYTLF